MTTRLHIAVKEGVEDTHAKALDFDSNIALIRVLETFDARRCRMFSLSCDLDRSPPYI